MEKRKFKTHGGYTYIEAISAIAIVILTLFVLYTGWNTVFRAWTKLSRQQKELASVNNLDRTLADVCSKLILPYWVSPDSCISEGQTSLEITSGQGDAASSVTINWSETDISITDSHRTVSFPLTGTASILKNEGGQLWGIRVTVDVMGQPVNMIAPFGGTNAGAR